MKKQILFMMFMSLAFVFVGMNKSFGQIVADGSPDPYVNHIVLPSGVTTIDMAEAIKLACADSADALHPQPGVEYIYEIDVDVEAGSKVLWFVTDTTVIIDSLNLLTDIRDGIGGEYVLAAGTATRPYNQLNTVADRLTMNITWKNFDGTTPVLLVAYVEDENGCTDNIEVYRIEPVFNFTLDLLALDGSGAADTDTADCVSPIQSAIYDAANEQLVMDYGENWIYFSVNAANFAHSWMPTFQVGYSGTTGDAITVEWAYPDDAVADNDWYPTTESGGIYTSADSVAVQAASGVASATGEHIIVRVRVDHGNTENDWTAGVQELTFGVNGTMFDAVATTDIYGNADLDDLGEATVTDGPCVQVDFDDSIIYDLTPRPSVESATQWDSSVPTATPIQEFEPKN